MMSLTESSTLPMVNVTVDPNITDDYNATGDDYYYDYESSISDLPPDLVPNALGYGLTYVLGVVGNILVIISVARYRRMQNVTNIFLLSLASADLLLLLICLPIKLAKFFTFTWTFGAVLCKGVHYLQNVVIICSVANLTGLSLERYYAILHPMRAKYTCTVTLARRTVLVLWVLSIIMGVPTLVGQQHILVGERRPAYWCQERWGREIYHQLYQIYMFFLVFLLPLTLMTFAYASICRKLWLVRYHRASIRASNLRYSCQETILLNGNPSETKRGEKVVPGVFTVRRKRMFAVDEDSTRKQVIKMLVAVIVLFALCWGPIMVNNLLVAFGVLDTLHTGYLKPMRQVFWLMSYFNSCVNPIVYGFMSKNFRDTFRYTIGICCLKKVPNRTLLVQGRGSLPIPSGQSTSLRAPSIQVDRWNYPRNSKGNTFQCSPSELADFTRMTKGTAFQCSPSVRRSPKGSTYQTSPSELTDLRKCQNGKNVKESDGHVCKISKDFCRIP